MGTIEEFPRPAEGGRPGYMGADQIVNSQALWTMRLADPGVEIDARAFLRARILDLFVGDYDRNHEQWRWAHVPGQAAFVPLPEDPDMAFARQDGFVMARLRGHEPRFQVFSERYPKAAEAELGQADLDRWVLPPLDRAAFRAEAESLQAAFTDAVIEDAVRAMPAEWHAINGEALASALKARRNGLVPGHRPDVPVPEPRGGGPGDGRGRDRHASPGGRRSRAEGRAGREAGGAVFPPDVRSPRDAGAARLPPRG